MLNPFPELLVLGILAPFVLRVTLGIIFLILGYRHLRREHRTGIASKLRVSWGAMGVFFIWYLGIFELIIGVMLLVGFLTQIAALIGSIIAIKMLVLRKRYNIIAPHSALFYVLVLSICLSLLLSGAGGFAFDLPL